MKYNDTPAPIDAESRNALNEKVLYLIDSRTYEHSGITAEDIYNAYTGDGGLHGLHRGNYTDYHVYSEAKKEIENGQFFTPPGICQLVAESLRPSSSALIADLTCGKGSFFNFFPVESNLYGCELDAKAYKVAQFLFPKANLTLGDIRSYQPNVRFDYVVGNPPFNLRWYVPEGDILSQMFFCRKAAGVLKPLGIMALVVPKSFLADDFADGKLIKEMESQFSFLGQIGLPDHAFASLGVECFPTKLQFWQKTSDITGWTAHRYSTELLGDLPGNYDVGAAAVQLYEHVLALPKANLEKNQSHALLELARSKEASKGFAYQTQKMLYQIKIHPQLKDKYSKCCEYLYRFYTEKQPQGMPYETWAKKCITEAKVLSYLRRTLKKQAAVPERDVIALVKQDYSFAYKGYSAAMRKFIKNGDYSSTEIYRAVLQTDDCSFKGYGRLLRKKRREYELQSHPFCAMEEDEQLSAWLTAFSLWDAENEETIHLNEMQRHDMNRILQKRYSLLQWEQGSGKTLAGIATGCYRMAKQNVHSTWVISSAISIRNNWDVVLENYGLPHALITGMKDLECVRPGDFVLLTFNKVGQWKKQIIKWLKRHSQKVQLILDESDNISNPSTVRTKAVLACFRRCRYKLLTTGTSTRNNISEFAPQLELLYNNSINMMNWCPEVYSYTEDTDDPVVVSEANSNYGQPIPAYKKGYAMFTACHLPEKTTVFGVGERTQDIYNAEALNDILAKTVITRTFEEVAGKKIKRIHPIPLRFSEEERKIYERIINEFHVLQREYFSSTGNSRKDAMLRLMQQITLLLRFSAAPNTMREYTGDTPVKLMAAVDMAAQWENEIVAVGVRHKVVLDAYAEAFRTYLPDRPLFVVTGSTTSFAQRRALRKKLRESGNGILLCTQQSLPSSVNFEFVNKVLIPELYYNNASMSQFYMRFVRYNSVDFKDIYLITYADSLESNLMQMVIVKEKLNLFMKGQETDLDEIYERFGIDYDLQSLLLWREMDQDGRFQIRWGEQRIAR